MRAFAALLLVASAGGLPAATAAAADEVETLAKAHFDAATKALATGEYDTAVEQFRASYDLKPYPDLLINIAHCYERVYKPDRAREYYERFLAEAPAGGELRALAEKRLRVLRNLPGSILVDANKDAAVVLTGPGGLRESAPAPHRWTELAPGEYQVEITLADHVPVRERLTLAPGETQAFNRRLVHQVEQLTVFSVPDGARVFIDDRDEGVTPFSRAIETGRGRHLRLEAPDYPRYEEKFDLQAGKPVRRRIALPRPPSSGRTEMALGAMAWGGFASASLAVAIGGTRVSTGTGLIILVPTALAGVGAGFLAAWALTDDSMKVGHSSIILGSTLFGGVLGASLGFGLGLPDAEDQRQTQRNTLALTLLGSGLGLGAGIVTAWLNDTSAGDAAIVNSGGIWGALSGTLLTEAISFRIPDHGRAFGWITLGTTAGGVLAGGLFARYFEASRGQVALVDAAALLGTVLGYSIGYAAGDDSPDSGSGTICPGSVKRCVSGARYALGGMAVGMLAASILTRKYKDRLPRTEALLTRHDDRWALGLPRLRLNVAPAPEGIDRQAIVDLLRGEF